MSGSSKILGVHIAVVLVPGAHVVTYISVASVKLFSGVLVRRRAGAYFRQRVHDGIVCRSVSFAFGTIACIKGAGWASCWSIQPTTLNIHFYAYVARTSKAERVCLCQDSNGMAWRYIWERGAAQASP